MKKILKHIYKYFLKILPDKSASKIHYFLVYKRLLSFSSPEFFSEKMIKMKLEKPRYLDVLCTDKITSKELLIDMGFKDYLIKNLYVFSNVDHIYIDPVQYPVIIKVSNGTSQHIVCRNEDDLQINIHLLKRMFNFRHYLYSKEIVYGMAQRKILVEPFLSTNRDGLDDYKVHCFNGVPRFVQINYNNTTNRGRVMINQSLQQVEFPFASGQELRWSSHNLPEIKEMMNISSEISRFFKFIRIDFFIVNNKIKIGELTLHPMAGFMLRKSPALDYEWGKVLNI